MKNTAIFIVFAILITFNAAAQVPETPPDVAAPPEDAVCTESGLCSKVQVAGTAEEHPDAWDNVTVHYSGWTTDGKLFDSSFKRGKPATFPLNRVIPGWTEGLQLMVEGEVRRLWIPTELQLLGIDNQPEPPPPPKTPEDVAAPPADAETTASGLASKVLRPGVGQSHPKKSSTVTVHYSGWTTDGKLFDSSVMRGQPATFPLNRVIPGWTEGLQLMVAGERRRLWIPEKLAYKGAAGAPQGMLVFDVELIEFK
jgi:peptidylprolyl isomerase